MNADLIANGLSPFKPEKAALEAGRLLLSKIHRLSKSRKDFAFESTLSGKTYISFLRDIKKSGYKIHILFLWLTSASLACQRVADRVKQGGHNIPVKTIKRRYKTGLLNFWKYYEKLADDWAIFDNSYKGPELIARKIEKIEIISFKVFDKIRNKYEK